MSPTIYLSLFAALLLTLLFSIIISSKSAGKFEVDFDSLIESLPVAAIVGFCVGLVIWVIIGITHQPERIEYNKPNRVLSVLKDEASSSGSFFLGSGSFSGEMKYYGYENLGDDRYKMVKFPNSSIIIEDVKDGEESYFVEIRKHSSPEDEAFKNDKWMMGPFNLDNFIRWEIHIPKGSILQGKYELDLE